MTGAIQRQPWPAPDILYAACGAEFKLNLFPLPMQLDGLTPWSTVFRGQPALVPKERYLDLCRHGAPPRPGGCHRISPP